jgi:hypothetical protein
MTPIQGVENKASETLAIPCEPPSVDTLDD